MPDIYGKKQHWKTPFKKGHMDDVSASGTVSPAGATVHIEGNALFDDHTHEIINIGLEALRTQFCVFKGLVGASKATFVSDARWALENIQQFFCT